ncbi:MAG TPA: serine/threonine-protein kinase [Polyangia bacterium]|jgi:Serine/threonine protein kinase|nr:serine/threonine-protein kinase [Polyangia bacterium]
MASAKDLKGTRLGRYTLVEHLATGGMAEIFLARHEAEGAFRKDLVLKILQPRWAEHQAVVDMFLGEARIAAMLFHPNIVDVYDVASEDGTHFIAMEYIRGKTLTELARRAIEVSQLLYLDIGAHIVGEVASALAYMDEAPDENGQPMHVVHRDVSPTNVIIGTSGHVKLIDFGIARQGTAIEDEAGMRPGKASYMSPEQAQGVPLDGRSDIFSLGTILYEITVGRRLWRGSKVNSIRRIVEEKPVPPTYVRHDYPGDLEMIVMRALEKKPEDRYQSAREFAEDLQRFLQDSGARMRSHHQLARYLRQIFSPEAEAQITEDGLLQARIFAEGDEDGQRDGVEALDFDRAPSDGPGAALARALRASGPALWVDGRAPADSHSELPSAEQSPRQDGPVPAATQDGQGTSVSSNAELGSADVALSASQSVPASRQTPVVARISRAQKALAKEDNVPRSVPIGAVLFVAVLLAAAVTGLVWLLRGG